MRRIVADSSALLELLLGTDIAHWVRSFVRRRDTDLHVPSLCDVEVVSGLRRGVMGRIIDSTRAVAALDDYRDLTIIRHGHGRLLPRMFDLRANFSAYDACYVALAEQIGGEILTVDMRLRRAIERHATVVVVS